MTFGINDCAKISITFSMKKYFVSYYACAWNFCRIVGSFYRFLLKGMFLYIHIYSLCKMLLCDECNFYIFVLKKYKLFKMSTSRKYLCSFLCQKTITYSFDAKHLYKSTFPSLTHSLTH